jgi:hypothetical protein
MDMNPEKSRDERRKEVIEYFALGWTILIIGYVFMWLLMPAFTWPLPENFWLRMQLANMEFMVFAVIGGAVSLFAFLKLIDYTKSKSASG